MSDVEVIREIKIIGTTPPRFKYRHVDSIKNIVEE